MRPTPEPEIEVTPAMIKAGKRALDYWSEHGDCDAAIAVVMQEIYLAMERAKKTPPAVAARNP